MRSHTDPELSTDCHWRAFPKPHDCGDRCCVGSEPEVRKFECVQGQAFLQSCSTNLLIVAGSI